VFVAVEDGQHGAVPEASIVRLGNAVARCAQSTLHLNALAAADQPFGLWAITLAELTTVHRTVILNQTAFHKPSDAAGGWQFSLVAHVPAMRHHGVPGGRTRRGAGMESGARSSALRWPEVAGDSSRPQKQLRAAICPVVIEEAEPTFFNTMAAASRFLHLVKLPVHGLIFGPPQALKLSERQALQCYRLSRHGLASCSQCRVGKRSRAQEAREYARRDERW
jgi:hypothetical protein